MTKKFINAHIVCENQTIEGNLCVKDGKIESVGKKNDEISAEVIDVNGGYVLPGFVDLHVHGGGGADFMDCDPLAFKTAVDAHLSHGTTTICPTTMSCEFDKLKDVVKTYRLFAPSSAARLGGLHLEGPFISLKMCGAQRKDLIYPPTEEHVRFIKENVDAITRISCAPEVEGCVDMAKKLLSEGVKFSMGHTNATYEQAELAYDTGFSSVTHLYCGTSGFHKVNQRVCVGVTQAAFGIEKLYVELIGDGRHIPKELLRLVVKIKGTDLVCLVTDAMRAAGTDAKESFLGDVCPENRVIIEDEVAKLPDRSSYAGSVGTMDKAFRFAVKDCGLAPSEASKLVSLNPARLLGMADKIGSIQERKEADLVMIDENFNVVGVYVKGEKVF